MTRELLHRFPATRDLPHVELASLPTPVERLDNVAKTLGVGELWVKRDDLTGTLYGGNKVRKLEFLLADAVARGFDRVWTVGAIGSHHVLATCIWAREIGLGCGALHFPQPITRHVQKNIRALSTTRPDIHLLSRDPNFGPSDFRDRLKEWLEANPGEYYIPAGGSSAIGAIGYVNAALEFVRQVEDGECPRPDRIYVAAGTCGTLAGLLLGFAIADFSVEVVGVRVVDRAVTSASATAGLANAAAQILATYGVAARTISPQTVTLRDDQFGEGYGIATDEALSAIELAGTDGLVLEPTYTGKAFAALVADREAIARRGVRALYWHTLSGADLGDRVAAADLDVLPPEYAEWATAPVEAM